MKDILLKRNDLKKRSVGLRTIKFDEEMKDKDVERILNEQHKVYNKWKFYDGMAKVLNNKKEH